MYYVNKIVGWVTSPVGVFFLGLALGALLRRSGKFGLVVRNVGTAVLFLSIAQLWFFSCGATVRLIGVPLEGIEARWGKEADGEGLADAVVLLGGGVGVHAQCGRPEIFSGADRAWTAAKAFKAGRAPIMTVSGGGARGELAFLADMGVDTNRVVVLESARNTEEEATLIAGAINEVEVGGRGGEGRPKILLVTSAWHMPRARMLFERAGFEVAAVPTDYEMNFAAEYPLKLDDFLPNAEALVRNSYAVKEWVARACYWAKAAL